MGGIGTSIFADANVGGASLDAGGSASVGGGGGDGSSIFGPPPGGRAHPLHPTASGFGLGFWGGVGGIVLLIVIRQSLPR